MAVELRGVTQVASSEATSATFKLHESAAAGDIALVAFEVIPYNAAQIAESMASAGFSAGPALTNAGNLCSVVFYKRVVSEDLGKTFTITWTGTSEGRSRKGTCAVFKGNSSSLLIDGAVTAHENGFVATAEAPSVTTTQPNSLLVHIMLADGSSEALEPPPGFTAVAGITKNYPYFSTATQATAGASGAKTGKWKEARWLQSHMLAIPVAAGSTKTIPVAESTGPTESYTKKGTKAAAESTAPTESYVKKATKGQSESTTPSEAFSSKAAKILGESTTPTESWTLKAVEPEPEPPRSTRRIERKPPLELDVEAVTAEGDVFRLPADARLARNRPTGLSCSSERAEGFSTGGLTLYRDIFRSWPDLNLLDTWRMVGREGFVAYEGRLAGLPRQNSGGESITLNLVGWMSYLNSRPVPMLIIEGRLPGFQEPSLQRRASLAASNIRLDGNVDGGWRYIEGAATPGVFVDFSGVTTASGFADRGESWFYAGGEDIGALLYHFVRLVGGAGPEWLTQAALSSDDLGTTLAPGTNHEANSNSSEYETVSAPGPGYKFAKFNSNRQAASTGAALTDLHDWGNPKVIGTHGLPLVGTWPELGVELTSIVEYMLSTYFPKVSLAPGSPRSSFPVAQFTGHDVERDGYESLQTLNNLILWETNVFEDRLLHMEPADLTKFDWWIDTTDPGVTVNFQGETIEDFANGIVVKYTDFSERTWTLWPSEHVELRDEDENNPANRHGEAKYISKTVPWACTEVEALQFGASQLVENNRPKRPGSFTIQGGYLRDAAGHLQQGYKVRNSETLGIRNHPDEAEPRLITKPSWDPSSSTLTIAVDAPPRTLEAIVARQQLAREARNLG